MTAAGLFRNGREVAGPAALSEALFGGELVTFALDPVAALAARARAIVAEHFGPDPETAEQRLDAETFRVTASRARKAVAEDAEIDALWHETLAAIGYTPDSVRSDRVRLRIAPSQPAARSRFARPLPAHRDSWGSNIMCQINWWAPLYELAPTRTMVLWPDAFTTPVANTSHEWDYDTLISGSVKNYPLLPEVAEQPANTPVPVLIAPGQLLSFSAAHLHASTCDDSGRTRFSLDTRSIWQADIDAGRGAPNVDGADTPPRWEMFERATSGARPGKPEQAHQGGTP